MYEDEFEAMTIAEVEKIEWSQYKCACSPASIMPQMWSKFLEYGDPDWEFGNELCHQGTMFSSLPPLVPMLILIAKSQHRSRVGALHILSATLDCSTGPLGYTEFLRQSKIPNPFKPKEFLKIDRSTTETELAAEAKSLSEAKRAIESEVSSWRAIAESTTDQELRMAALELLASVGDNEHRQSAHQSVLAVYANATEDEQDQMQRFIRKIVKQ